MRVYLSEIIGTGTIDDPYRTAIADHILRSNSWADIDGRTDMTTANGEMFTFVFNPTQAEHDLIVADSRIKYLPLEDNAGQVLGLNDAVGDIKQNKRVTIKTELENRHIPFDDIQLTDTIRSALKRIIKRFLLRQILKDYDVSEHFDTLLSSIAVAKRQSIAQKLEALGFDTSGLIGSMTVKEALKALMAQNNKWIRTNL